MTKELVKLLAQEVKSFTARALDTRLGPIEAAILRLEASTAAELAALRKENAELRAQLEDRDGQAPLRAVR